MAMIRLSTDPVFFTQDRQTYHELTKLTMNSKLSFYWLFQGCTACIYSGEESPGVNVACEQNIREHQVLRQQPLYGTTIDI